METEDRPLETWVIFQDMIPLSCEKRSQQEVRSESMVRTGAIYIVQCYFAKKIYSSNRPFHWY